MYSTLNFYFSRFIISILLLTGITYGQTSYSGSGGFITDDHQNNDFSTTVATIGNQTLGTVFGLKEVCVTIYHTNITDLSVEIIAPDGTSAQLATSVGNNGQNFDNTCFNMSANTSIRDGQAPFSDSFKPISSLGIINNGQHINGEWKLRIIDYVGSNFGLLSSWNITFGNNAEIPPIYTSTIPLLIIDTHGQEIPSEPKISAEMKIIYKGNGQLNSSNDVANVYNGNIAIETRGAFSASLPQTPYGFETRDIHNNQLDTILLGMPKEHDWCLIPNYNDKVFVRNTLAYYLFRNLGHYATRTKHCEVILNGQYQGIYILCEKIKRDNNRVDISKLDTLTTNGDALTGGYIIKNDYYDSNNSWVSNYHPLDVPSNDVHVVYEYPKATTINNAQKTYIQNFINDFETALYDSNYADAINGYRKYISVNSFIDYFIVEELARNNDGFKKSSYFHKNKNSKGGKLKAGPVWDFDWAWKNINECSFLATTDGSGWAYKINECGVDVPSFGWYIRLLQDSSFTNELRCRWNAIRTSIINTTSIDNYIDSVNDVLNSSITQHYKRWPTLGLNTGAPEVDNAAQTYAEELIRFKNWIATRIAWLDQNIPGSCSLASSVESISNNNTISLYPNPAQNQLFFNGKWKGNLTIKIQNTIGQIVAVYILKQAQDTSIDISTLTNGMYEVIAIDSNYTTYKSKLVVVH